MARDATRWLAVAEDRVQISIPLPPGASAEDEALWATPLGGGTYRIENIPFSAYGLSLGDEVIASRGRNGLRIARVARRAGHSTYRVLVWPDVDVARADEMIGRVELAGCGVERATQRWIAIDVPPSADRAQVLDLLEIGWKDGVWRYEGGDEEPAQ